MGTLKINKKVANIGAENAKSNEKLVVGKSARRIDKQAAEKPIAENIKFSELAKQDEGFAEEFKNLRTANETVYKRHDKTCRKIITATPTRYRDANGELKEISNHLIDNGNEIVNEANSFKVKFNKDIHDGKIFDLQRFKKTISLSAVGMSKARSHACGCKCELCLDKDDTISATLDDGTEIQYVTMNDRIKENIIVKERQDKYEYNFALNIGDLSVEEGDNNDLLLKDGETGETMFIIPAPYMYDANHSYSDKVSYEIEVNDSELAIKVVADSEFINEENRAFPVVIDPQILLPGDGKNITFETRTQWLDEDERITYDKTILEVEDRNIIRDAFVYYTMPTLSDIENVTSVKLYLTVREGKGKIMVNKKSYSVQGQDIDIAVTLSGGNNFRVEPTYKDNDAYAKFYTTGAKGPRFVIDYVENAGGSEGEGENTNTGSDNTINTGDNSGSNTSGTGNNTTGSTEKSTYDEDNVPPTMKEFDFADKVKGLLYVKDGNMVTTFTSCQSEDSLLPIKIKHIHKYGFGESSYGLNWRLNVSKTLKAASDDNVKTTKYIYTDELGDSYPLTEKYYYMNNGKRVFIDKNLVAIDLSGNLTYNDKEVYKYQSCNNYTLISKIDDFKNYDLIEQRQDEQAQLENYIAQMAPNLSSYVKVYGPTGQVVGKLESLNKKNYETLIKGVDVDSSYVIVTGSEACQLQSLYTSKNQLNTQKYQIETQRSQLALQKQQLEIQQNQYINQNRQMSDQIQNLKDNKKLSEAIYSNVSSLVNINTLTIPAYVNPDKDHNNEERNEKISKAREYLSYKSTDSSLYSLNGETFGQYKLLKEQQELVKKQIDAAQGQINAVDGQLSDCEKQVTLLEDQISTILKQAKLNLEYVKNSFMTYFRKEAERDMLLKQIPVNYLRDENGIISGFNADGNLVMISDAYDNYVAISYNNKNLITSIQDDKKRVMYFKYADGYLDSITDDCGRTVRFEYNGKKLEKAIIADDNYLTFKYANNRLGSVNYNVESQFKMSYTDGKLTTLMEKRLAPVSGTVSELNVLYNTDSVEFNYDDGTLEFYIFDHCSRVEYYKKRDGALFEESTSIRYDYENGKKVTCLKRKSPDYIHEVEIQQYNDIDLLVSKIEDWNSISDTVRVKTETVYSYDLDNKLINETTTKYIDNSDTVSEIVSIKNYSYNAQGALILTESYISGEELISGKNYKQVVYDENGRAVRNISWNSLDSSSKFYEESDRAENGQVVAEKDETGEISSEYEYAPNSNTVNAIKMANGSTFAYGRNPNTGVITSITQSTENGEANTTNIVYEQGLPIQVKSGNTVIDYTYEGKGRKKTVKINGVLQSEFGYEGYKRESYDDVLYAKDTQTLHIDGKTIKSVYLKQGYLDDDVKRMVNFEQLTVGNDKLYYKNYNNDGELEKVTYKDDSDKTVCYEYDEYHNLINAETASDGAVVLTESYNYNEFGELAEKAYTGEVKQTYSYRYKQNAARDLDYIAYGDYKFIPLTDVNGRNVGREIFKGNNKVATEHITYRKVGDHATNMPATVWFGSGSQIKDSLKYKYDRCGNIVEIVENGHIIAKYKYDELNRLIREDNRYCETTFLFSYDQNGNITERCEYPYTLKSGEELAELECKHYSYDYEGDKLVNYNGKSFAYNSIGNPKVYCDKVVEWQYGTNLIRLGDTTFKYDGLGRRTNKGDVSFIYDNDGNLIKQSNGLEFIYDNSNVVGVKYEDALYFYRRDTQGNIVAILDSNGSTVVKYVYDAWGNNIALDANGEIVESGIGILNPFRYRGYYYDTETGLYYLQTRYYDPEIGRFISQDSIEYADPETINGLNLYAYCGNNPVMNIDPTGTSFLVALLIGALIAGLVAGTVNAVSAAYNGESVRGCVGAFFGGFITGAVLGAATILGGGLAVGAITATASVVVGIGAFLTFGTFAAGVLSYSVENLIKGDPVSSDEALKSGLITFGQGLLSFGEGFVMGKLGLFDYLKPGNGLGDAVRATNDFARMEIGKATYKSFFRGVGNYFRANTTDIIIRSIINSIIVSPWNGLKP